MKTLNKIKTVIKQDQDFFNPYFINGKQIQSIKFFNSNGVVASCKWFGDGSNNGYPLFVLPMEVKRKLKIDYSKNSCFYVKNNEQYFEGVNLYIPIDILNHSIEKHILNFSSNFDDNFYDVLTINLESVKLEHKLNDLKKLVYFNGDLKKQDIRIKFNYTSEPTKLGLKCAKLAKDFEDVTKIKHISKYEIERLLNTYNITKKRK